MKLAYIDTSCLVAVAFGEPAAEEMSERFGEFSRLIASNLLEAELRSALSRERVDADCRPLLSWISWVYPDRPLTAELEEILSVGHVRGADLWQLACALFLRRRLTDLAFLTLDRRQHELAVALGLRVE